MFECIRHTFIQNTNMCTMLKLSETRVHFSYIVYKLDTYTYIYNIFSIMYVRTGTRIFDTDFFCRLNAKYFYFPWKSIEKKGIMISIRWRFHPSLFAHSCADAAAISLLYPAATIIIVVHLMANQLVVRVIQASQQAAKWFLALTGLIIKTQPDVCSTSHLLLPHCRQFLCNTE